MRVMDLLRADLRAFAGYSSARSSAVAGFERADVWLNANESPWANATDPKARLRRYPDPQPMALRQALAQLYGVDTEQLLIGRGSDEGIDLLLRAFCRPGADAVVITPPVFGMYAVCARLHGCRVIEQPLRDSDAGFQFDLAAMATATLNTAAKLLFVCSPGNPTGQVLAIARVRELARRLAGRALLVLDEAYIEFADQASCAALLEDCDNLVLLRTLSKAHALAAARIGCVLAHAEIIAALRRCQAPYPLVAASVDAALAALADDALLATRQRSRSVIDERERLRPLLSELPGVRRVYSGQGNFLLLRFEDADAAFRQLLAAGIVVRDVRGMPQLDDALRISIGSPEQNQRLLMALSATVAT